MRQQQGINKSPLKRGKGALLSGVFFFLPVSYLEYGEALVMQPLGGLSLSLLEVCVSNDGEARAGLAVLGAERVLFKSTKSECVRELVLYESVSEVVCRACVHTRVRVRVYAC